MKSPKHRRYINIIFIYYNRKVYELYQNLLDEKLMNLQENEDVNIENFSITTEIQGEAFEALGQREKNNRKSLE